jgi:predicted ATPase
VLGAYRPEDIALGQRQPGLTWERHLLEPARLELQRAFGEIELNLDQSEGMSFINALVDSEPNCLDETFRQTLYRHTEGNPLFTIELLRSMQERGDLVHDPSGLWVTGRWLDWERLPARVEAVIAERIGRLPLPQQELLRAASVEGETFTAEVSANVLGLDEHQVLGWLSGLLSREQKIVQALNVAHARPTSANPPTRLSRYHFNHIYFQKFLYHTLDPVERSTLHERTGITLENLYGPMATEIALQLAWHFEQAGRYTRAAEFLLVAAKQAMNLSAPLQARALYDRCLGLLRQIPQSPESIHLEIQVQLAQDALFGG